MMHTVKKSQSFLHSKKCWVVSTQIWVKINKPKFTDPNLLLKVKVEDFKLHFEPNIWDCPYLTQIRVKTTQHFQSVLHKYNTITVAHMTLFS